MEGEDMSQEDGTELSALIKQIESGELPAFLNSGVMGLLAAIPCAGGTLATVITDFETKRRTEKICDALSFLQHKVTETRTKIEDVLTADQVNELLHKTLREIALSSEQKHIEYLKNALANSFTTTGTPFQEKRFYMAIVEQLTGIEIVLLESFYAMGDPFIIDIRKPVKTASFENTALRATVLPTIQSVTLPIFQSAMSNYEIRFEDKRDVEPLLKRLAQETGLSESIIPGIAGRLDGKGLCLLAPNLTSRRCKIRTERDYSATSVFTNAQETPSPDDGTPVEKSRTKFGEDFLRFVRRC
jgi:hypothetical protein